MIFRLLCALALLLALVLPSQAWIGSKHGGTPGGGGSFTYFCDAGGPTGGNCAYAFSVTHKLMSTATQAFVVQRASDNTTLAIGFQSSPPYLTDHASADTFCASTTYGVQEIFDQKGSGCNPIAQWNSTVLTVAQMLPYQTTAYGSHTIVQSVNTLAWDVNQPTTFPQFFVTSTSCGALAGTGAKSLVIETNSTYQSNLGGMIGIGEDTITNYYVTGSMFAAVICNSASFCTSLSFGLDEEAGGAWAAIPSSPADGIGIIAAGAATSNLINAFWNGSQILTNATPTFPLATESRMNIGCDGGYDRCGPTIVRSVIMINSDQTSNTGAINTFLQAFYAGL